MIEKNPSSRATVAIASSWLRNCPENHSSCNPPPGSHKPLKRLINGGNETQKPFLVNTSSASRNFQWLLSLSHRWGEPPIKAWTELIEITEDRLKNGIDLDKFDHTIRDAIVVARALDISYVWIDSLCIVQGGGEWNEEASKMNELYGGSTVTLVAASSNSVMDGILNERQSEYIPISSSTVRGKEPPIPRLK